MKIRLHNLGPISKFEFDLSKDLNVVFGKNNIGKSYAITAIYLIIKNLINTDSRVTLSDLYLYYMRRSRYIDDSDDLPKIVKDIAQIEREITSQFNDKINEVQITTQIERILSKLISESLIPKLDLSFNNSFSSLSNLRNKFSKKDFLIELICRDFDLEIGINNKSKLFIKELKLKNTILVKKIKTNRKPTKHNDVTIIYYNIKTSLSKKKVIGLLDDVLMSIVTGFSNEVSNVVNNIYFLPASRSGLYQALSTFSAVIAELSKSRNFLSKKIELPNISEPVSDYFLYLSDITTSKPNKKYAKISKSIEKSILDGEIRFNRDTKKIVFYSNKINSELDLSVTSSMISEIAPIVAYLKYIISNEPLRARHMFFYLPERKSEKTQPANLIFVEEPEAHLHPEIQVKLMEYFASLIKLHVKIVMTTHSNYMFNKLSNLILESQVNYNVVGSYLMKMTDAGSIIDEVAMKADDEGIVDENFAGVAEKLYEERLLIYDELSRKDAN